MRTGREARQKRRERRERAEREDERQERERATVRRRRAKKRKRRRRRDKGTSTDAIQAQNDAGLPLTDSRGMPRLLSEVLVEPGSLADQARDLAGRNWSAGSTKEFVDVGKLLCKIAELQLKQLSTEAPQQLHGHVHVDANQAAQVDADGGFEALLGILKPGGSGVIDADVKSEAGAPEQDDSGQAR